MKLLSVLLSTFVLAAVLVSCGKSSGTGSLPLITPPVKAAAPTGFQTRTGHSATSRALSTSEFSSRFFTTGPTSIFRILTDIDSRLTDINSRTTGTTPCMAATPVAYNITAWGQTVEMYAQCYEILSGATTADPKLVQWGVKDGKTYLYAAVGAARVAAITTPNASVAGRYNVKAYIGVGYTNTGGWDTQSYGVIQIDADSNANTFEMSTAGIGFGYCGVQLKSDGTNVYASGSADGAGTACAAPDTLCVQAASVSTAGTCGTSVTGFALPAAGRAGGAATSGLGVVGVGTWAASSNATNVTLNGTSTDSLAFGPTTATTGAVAF